MRNRQNPKQQLSSSLSPGLFIKLFIVTGLLILITWGLHRINVDYYGSSVNELKSGLANVCLDDYHNQKNPGTEVDSATCNGRPSQDWRVQGLYIKHDNFCLSLPANATAASNKLTLNSCANQPGQAWIGGPLGDYENPSTGLCLAIPNEHPNQQLVAAACDNLTGPSETWQPSVWSRNNTSAATVQCNFSNTGEEIACDAAKQWLVWRSGNPNHPSLLNSYSDGNGYEEWCADFVSYIYKQAGRPLSGGERDGWDEYLADGVQYDGNFTMHMAGNYTPKAGDVAYFNYSGGHVEIVAVGGTKPIFVYGDSGQTDPATGNGNMAENTITQDGSNGQVVYYLSPS